MENQDNETEPTEPTEPTPEPDNVCTVNGRKLTWQVPRHAHILGAVRLSTEDKTLGRVAAWIVCDPKLAKRVKFRYNLVEAAQDAIDYLAEHGWSYVDILTAGESALAFLFARMPPIPSSPEVEEGGRFFGKR